MRQITKGPEPQAIRHWKEENAAVPQNLTYENMPKAPVKLQMLAEQGHLCAYTMQRIPTVDDCHIEHIVPQSQPNQPQHLDIDYNNLLACVPSNTPGHRPQVANFPYGASKKGHTCVDDNNFVSPLREDVEARFRYSTDGSVAPAASDGAAASTINILRLNHGQLRELRRAAIDERILDRDFSADEAEALSRTIMTADTAGRMPEFCLAISQVATWYANRVRKLD
jgi:uncharacterized protein (TIGR02646 family)